MRLVAASIIFWAAVSLVGAHSSELVGDRSFVLVRDPKAVRAYEKLFPGRPHEGKDYLNHGEIDELSRRLAMVSGGAAVQIGPPTSAYNCHGYTLSRLSPGTSPRYASRRALREFLEKHADRITNVDEVRVGDVAFWDEGVDHSGIVSDKRTIDDVVRVALTSKWSELGLYCHDIDYSPYPGAGLRSASFFRLNRARAQLDATRVLSESRAMEVAHNSM